MSTIIYGGSKDRVKNQLECAHTWYGPCMDDISRYYKCIKCFCIDRDCHDMADYDRLVKERDETLAEGKEEFIANCPPYCHECQRFHHVGECDSVEITDEEEINMVKLTMNIPEDVVETLIEIAKKEILEDEDALVNYAVNKALKVAIERRSEGWHDVSDSYEDDDGETGL